MSKISISKLEKDVEKNPFPVTTLDPEVKKTKSFGLKIGKHINAKAHLDDATSNKRVLMQENRDYASNRQDINKYKPLLDAAIDEQGGYKLYEYRLEYSDSKERNMWTL